MYLIELLLPLYDNANRPFDRDLHESVRAEMTERFGGVTSFSRSPAEGFWKESENNVQRDDVIIMEVMVEELDSQWWATYRHELEKRFKQEQLVLRATTIQRL